MENNYSNMKKNKKWRINKRKVMFVFIIPLIIAGIIFSVVTYINTKREEAVVKAAMEEEEDNIFRIDPVKNPQVTYYNFRGEEYPDWAKFGMTRSNGIKAHQGIDIFAVPGTDVFAVLDGKIVDLYVDKKGYGLNFYLEVDPKELEKIKRKNYKPKEGSGEENYGPNYEPGMVIKSLRYCHLSEVSGKVGDTVNGNQLSKEEKKAQFEATQLVWKADKKYAEGFRLASVFMDEENERRLKEEEEKNKKISNNGKVSGRKKGSRR